MLSPPSSRETPRERGGHGYISRGGSGERSILLVEAARRE